MLGVRKVSTSLQWQPKPYMLIEHERSKEGRKKERKKDWRLLQIHRHNISDPVG